MGFQGMAKGAWSFPDMVNGVGVPIGQRHGIMLCIVTETARLLLRELFVTVSEFGMQE